MTSMAEYAFSLQMRDTIQKLAAEQVELARPKPRYGVVDSLDTGRRVNVTLNGETAPISVPYGSARPEVGQRVRVEGTLGDRYVADVIGAAYGTAMPTFINNDALASDPPNSFATGVTYTGTAVGNGFPFGLCVVQTIRISDTRQTQIIIEKTSGDTAIRSSSDGTTWGNWVYYGGGPICRLRQSSSQLMPANSWTNMGFQTEEEDPWGMHSTTTSVNWQVTIPVNGVYQVSASWATLDFVGSKYGRIYKNTAPMPGRVNTNYTGDGTDMAMSRTFRLAAGDVISSQLYTSAATSTRVVGSDVCSNLEVVYLRQ
jgi:hypothetical protein